MLAESAVCLLKKIVLYFKNGIYDFNLSNFSNVIMTLKQKFLKFMPKNQRSHLTLNCFFNCVNFFMMGFPKTY